jgi:hypothetical protein
MKNQRLPGPHVVGHPFHAVEEVEVEEPQEANQPDHAEGN